jgi:hypothetical protein
MVGVWYYDTGKVSTVPYGIAYSELTAGGETKRAGENENVRASLHAAISKSLRPRTNRKKGAEKKTDGCISSDNFLNTSSQWWVSLQMFLDSS